MSLRAINPDRLVPYIPNACFRFEEQDGVRKRVAHVPIETAPRFLLRPIPAVEMAEIEDELVERLVVEGEANAASSVEMRYRQGKKKLRILRAGLRGWERFQMPSAQEPGKLVDAPFEVDKAGVPTDRTLSMLDVELRLELANAITDIQHVSEDAFGK